MAFRGLSFFWLGSSDFGFEGELLDAALVFNVLLGFVDLAEDGLDLGLVVEQFGADVARVVVETGGGWFSVMDVVVLIVIVLIDVYSTTLVAHHRLVYAVSESAIGVESVAFSLFLGDG
jgi:hypothetical protein